MRFMSADRIFSGTEFLPADTVLVLNEKNTLIDIVSAASIEKNRIEYFKGILCPGFINAHCHLELSHLKGAIKQHTGIVDFGLSVIKHRNGMPAEAQLEHMQQADTDMKAGGIVAVGDISNTPQSLPVKKESPLYYHTFVELIALNPEHAAMVFDAGKTVLAEFETAGQSASLAPHASYTASLQLIKLITDHCMGIKKPTSIHNQESEAENAFFKTATGDYLRLYNTLTIPLEYYEASGKSSLQTILPAFNKAVNTLLVHNTFSGKEDLIVANKAHPNLYWCLCPNANLYIENTLPRIASLSASGCTLTFGTDGLASNQQLSITEEINTVLKHDPAISLETLLRAATFNGATFLGIEERFGSFEKNKQPGINLIGGDPGNYKVKRLA